MSSNHVLRTVVRKMEGGTGRKPWASSQNLGVGGRGGWRVSEEEELIQLLLYPLILAVYLAVSPIEGRGFYSLGGGA